MTRNESRTPFDLIEERKGRDSDKTRSPDRPILMYLLFILGWGLLQEVLVYRCNRGIFLIINQENEFIYYFLKSKAKCSHRN